jgi:multiple sugar transport system permease protein
MSSEHSWRSAEARAGLLFLSPALLVLAAFFFLPVLGGLLLSFTDFDIYALADAGNARFVGLANYAQILADPLFWKAFGNTLYFVLVGGPLSLAVSLGAALLVNGRLVKAKGFFRTVFFAPVVTTMVAVAIVFYYLYHPRFGVLNRALGAVGIAPIDWLGDPRWAMPAIILLAVWKNFGYNMVIFIAGLRNIPEELYEAARLDGATLWQQFRAVTLPSLKATFFLVGVITTIGYFQLFSEPYVMTRGGPLNATLSLVLYMYKDGFRFWNMGRAAAAAFLLFLVIAAVTLAQNRWARGEETEE